MPQTRIVIVEDEAIVALQIKMHLQQKGYQVVGTFASGDEALQNIESVSPDLVLMDLKLRGAMDGIDTARRISECLDVPIVYLTAHSDDVTVRRAKETGPYGYVLKPYTERELDIAIQIALYKHKLDSEKSNLLRELKLAHDTLEAKVQERTAQLTDANAALRVLLSQRDEDKNQLEEKILSNVKSLIFPCIEQVRKSDLSPNAASYLNLLESNLQSITSEFSLKLSSKYVGLTPKELEVAALIKEGKSTKDILPILGVSKATIDSHRNKIRTKLGIKSTNANLRSYLLSLK